VATHTGIIPLNTEENALGIWITLGILGVVVVVVFLMTVGIYNRLVVLKNRYLNGFSQIEVQLKRRHDLIPMLVETVKGYMKHEKETLEAVVEARNQAVGLLKSASKLGGDSGAMSSLGNAEGALSSAMGGLFAVMEAYPDLKANEQMLALQEELSSTENKVAFSRQAYNDSVASYNSYRQSFPQVMVASLIGHAKDAGFIEFEDSAQIQNAPEVSIR
jgi:LemA protein